MDQFELDHQINQVNNCETLDRLKKERLEFHDRCLHEVAYNDPIFQVKRINEVYDALIRRTVELCLKQQEMELKCHPPVPFQFVLYGSGGRREQTMWSDQDNGIIYDAPPPGKEKEIHHYFKSLGNRIVEALVAIGFPPCDGKVICSEDRWCISYPAWSSRINEWLLEPSWENIRYVLICCDVRPLYSYGQISFDVTKPMKFYSAFHPGLLTEMTANTLKYKMLLNIFGGFIAEKFGEDAGSVDVKYGAYIPMVNAIRLLAIEAGIRESSSLYRLEKLKSTGKYADEQIEFWKQAFIYFLKLRNQIRPELEDGSFTASGKLRIDKLSKEMKLQFKMHLKTGNALQKMIKKKIGKLP